MELHTIIVVRRELDLEKQIKDLTDLTPQQLSVSDGALKEGH